LENVVITFFFLLQQVF